MVPPWQQKLLGVRLGHKQSAIKRPGISLNKKAAFQRLFFSELRSQSTLTRLEARVALADHEHFAATAHNLAVTVPLLGGLQRGKHLHGRLLKRNGS
jgi:hypothetical protein